MARTPYRMKGMSFKEDQELLKNGNSGLEALGISKPGSSKESLVGASKQFISEQEQVDLDYGGAFDFDMGSSKATISPKKEETKGEQMKKQEKTTEKKSRYNRKKSKKGTDANKEKNIGVEENPQDWSDPNMG